MFVINDSVQFMPCGEGTTRKVLAKGGSLMMVEVTFKMDAEGQVHAHPHEQVSYISQGSFMFNVDGESKLIHQGDSVYIPSNVPHSVKALSDDSIILDVFTPQREDML